MKAEALFKIPIHIHIKLEIKFIITTTTATSMTVQTKRSILTSVLSIVSAELEAFQILTFKIVTFNDEAANYSANPLFLRCSITLENSESLIFSLKDGSTNTNAGKLFLLSKIQILIHNQFENINNNIYNIKVPTDKCFEHSFSSIRAKTAELESIDNLELLCTSNCICNNNDA
jgi:hypothetical protein